MWLSCKKDILKFVDVALMSNICSNNIKRHFNSNLHVLYLQDILLPPPPKSTKILIFIIDRPESKTILKSILMNQYVTIQAFVLNVMMFVYFPNKMEPIYDRSDRFKKEQTLYKESSLLLYFSLTFMNVKPIGKRRYSIKEFLLESCL